MLGGAAKIAASPATVGMGIAQGAADDRTAAVIHHGKQVVSDTISTASRAAAAPLNPGNWLELAETVTSLPGKFEKLGDAATAAAKELAGFSGEMATASIEKTFGDIRRDIQTAQQTGQSTLSLTRSLENLKDIMNPIKNEITNITNILLEAAVEAVIALEPLIVQILEYVKKGVILVLKWLADILEKWFGADGLASVAADAAEKISQIERNTRPEDDMGPLGKLLSDISEGGLGGF